MTYDGHVLVASDTTEHVGLEPGGLYAGKLFVGSLQGFLILRRLRVNTSVFVESPIEKVIKDDPFDYVKDPHKADNDNVSDNDDDDRDSIDEPEDTDMLGENIVSDVPVCWRILTYQEKLLKTWMN